MSDNLKGNYDEHYYANSCGTPYTRDKKWLDFFGSIADRIVEDIRPTTALDAGCAWGFLVESLRDRGVEAYGIDISSFAIDNVREDIKPYCWKGSVLDPFPQRYDLITCIEVLEHLPQAEAEMAVANLCRYSDDIIFSSTPDDYKEATHVNVHPVDYWAELFARNGFRRDLEFYGAVIAPQAMRFIKSTQQPHRTIGEYERKLWEQAREIAALREALMEARNQSSQQFDKPRQVEHDSENFANMSNAEQDLEIVRQENEELRAQLASSEELVRRHEAFIDAQNERLQLKETQVNLILGSRYWRAGKPVRKVAGIAKKAVRKVRPGRIDTTYGLQRANHKALFFLSGCPGDAKRYRCDHQVEQLELVGGTADVGMWGETDLRAIMDHYDYFILHRVPYGSDIEWFLENARQRDKTVIFETDDLVFDPDASRYVAALADMTNAERDLYLNGLIRYQKTMMKCDAVLVSTDSLRQQALRFHNRVYLAPNVVSQEMVRYADAALAAKKLSRRSHGDGTVTIAYFSGTRTHNQDFLEAADAIIWALENYRFVKFKAIGHLDLDSRFDRFGSRIERVPLQPWQDLPRIYASVDINLAPLEPNNPFTDAKSCLKYLEAGLLGVPTLASPRNDFQRVIRHGVNGLLAESRDEWREGLRQLVESAELRNRIGHAAYEDVRQHSTSLARATILRDTLRDIVQVEKGSVEIRKPLAINWILRAPIANTGGGYRSIFRLANHLGNQGHTVRVYVEPIAHLASMSHDEIRAFVHKHFGPLSVEVVVGHDRILPADATIATNWPTAYPVANHGDSLFKFYFVQDFEPEFYDLKDHHYHDALKTYSLPLQAISIGSFLSKRINGVNGRHVEVIDFAVDHTIFDMRIRPEDRPGPTKVLFFARPGLKRRGYELGIEALKRVKAQRPQTEILLYGSTDSELGPLPFNAKNLGVLSAQDVADALNHVHILLSFSFSNISWVPFEGMACGAAVVEANVPSVQEMVRAGENCLLADPNPDSVAGAIMRLIDDDRLRVCLAYSGVQEMSTRTWENSARQFEEILLRSCF